MARRELTAEEKAADDVTAGIIDEFHERMRALYFVAETQIPLARETQNNALKDLMKGIGDVTQALQKPDANVKERARAVMDFYDSLQKLSGNQKVRHDEMLAQSMLISAFSMFDAYLSTLLRNMYSRKPTLIFSLENREIHLADLLHSTREKIIESLIDDDIESLLRNSYSEKFTKLAKRFDVKLTGFTNWRTFVECSQRRNLVTHCDGIVSEQYLLKCREEGCKIPPDVVVGTKLTVPLRYLLDAIEVITETGIKLGQVIWRVSCEPSIPSADEHLANTIFESLKKERWEFVLRMSELSEELAKLKNQHLREARTAKILLINHAQAAKWSGDTALSMRLLDSVDWSDGLKEFQLAVAVLKEEYDNAAAIMHTIGPNAELCPIHGYVSWPIFREFRLTPQFSTAFESVFGVKFVDEVKKISDQSVLDQTPEGDHDASGPNSQVMPEKDNTEKGSSSG